MQYGYFDNENHEYVITDVNLPVPWTNYIGLEKLIGVFDHNANGYLYYESPEHHRITRFRANGLPGDGPGHYIYIRDDISGDYFSVSWQPVGKPLTDAAYECRHGLSYSKYLCDYRDIHAEQKIFAAVDDPVEIIDVTLTNTGNETRELSVYSYLEFSFHDIPSDYQNFQMSLYCSGSRYFDGIIEYELKYENRGYQFFTSNFDPDGYDCLRDRFIGTYRSEMNPLAVEEGHCGNSTELGGNHCAALQKKVRLAPKESIRLIYILGNGDATEGETMRAKYGSPEAADRQFEKIGEYWDDKLGRLQIRTPDEGMNTLINIWTLYQSEINVRFSRFSSFIEVGGRTGLGYRDTAQDAMCIPHSDPEKCKSRIRELLQALTKAGYGLHLFDPTWFDEKAEAPAFKSPLIAPKPKEADFVHDIKSACADDALWLIYAIVNYIKETGEFDFLDEEIRYADGGVGSVYEHMTKILDFSAREVGKNGICKGLKADWNDCLNLGGGESALVSFMLCCAAKQFAELAVRCGHTDDAALYSALGKKMEKTCNEVLWDGEWYIRGITADGRKIGTQSDTEGRVHLESNTWAVISGAADTERATKCMNAVHEHLSTEYGLMLNYPSYTVIDDSIGFITRVYPGIKENGAIFSHPNPWAWVAESILGRGDRVMEYYKALSPYDQNDCIEVRQSEPYSYCQFIMGKDHTAFGRARHPFMTGSAGWAYFAATQYILGIRPDYDRLVICPVLPKDWREVEVTRVFRGATYHILIDNAAGGNTIGRIEINGRQADDIPLLNAGEACELTVVMERQRVGA
jgi:N,N'-diacetylchitobiose phosphorylase